METQILLIVKHIRKDVFSHKKYNLKQPYYKFSLYNRTETGDTHLATLDAFPTIESIIARTLSFTSNYNYDRKVIDLEIIPEPPYILRLYDSKK